MDNLKFNFLLWGQLESLNLEKTILVTFIQNITMLRGNLIFAIIAQMLCGNHLNLRRKKVPKSYSNG